MMRRSGEFDSMAPVNVTETGRILRKTRFDLPRSLLEEIVGSLGGEPPDGFSEEYHSWTPDALEKNDEELLKDFPEFFCDELLGELPEYDPDCEFSPAEWMWVEVSTLEDRLGILMNQPLIVPGLEAGALVEIIVLGPGHPLSGCSVALWWSDWPVVDLYSEPWQGLRRVLGEDWEKIVRAAAAR